MVQIMPQPTNAYRITATIIESKIALDRKGHAHAKARVRLKNGTERTLEADTPTIVDLLRNAANGSTHKLVGFFRRGAFVAQNVETRSQRDERQFDLAL